MNLIHQAGFAAYQDHARRLRERRERENLITALVLFAIIVSCIGASVMVFASWF